MAASVLKTIVIVLAVLIIAAFGLVVWRIFGIVGSRSAPGFGEVSLALPSDCRITSMTTVDNRLALLTEGPNCNAVYIVDEASGEVIGRITP